MARTLREIPDGILSEYFDPAGHRQEVRFINVFDENILALLIWAEFK